MKHTSNTGDNSPDLRKDYSEDNTEIFTLEDIRPVEHNEDLYCLSVGSPEHQFLVGHTGIPTHNTDEAKAMNALKGEAQMIVGSIARLGRAAGVHLLIATQRPDARLLPGELKSNLGLRVACGNLNSIASEMVLGSNSATKVPGSPKGRGIMRVYSHEERMQIYFAPQDWIDGWLERRGKNSDGTPLESGPVGILPVEPVDLSGETLNSLQGIDNTDYIERLRDEDAKMRAEHARKLKELEENDSQGQLAESTDSSLEERLGYDPTGGMGRPDAPDTASSFSTGDWDDDMAALTQ